MYQIYLRVLFNVDGAPQEIVNIMSLDMLIELSDDIKPITVSDLYNLNVVGQVCQRGCPVHEYFDSNYSLIFVNVIIT